MNETVARARSLVGVRFRPQGRNPQTGLDCVGLVLLAFGLPTDFGRRDYRMRGSGKGELLAALKPKFRRIARTQMRVGDLMVAETAPGQLHLAIRSGTGLIHADAGLGKVVERPGLMPWPMVAVLRRRVRD